MKKIYFLSLVFTIGFCLALGSCRSGNRKKQNPVATQTDRSNIRSNRQSTASATAARDRIVPARRPRRTFLLFPHSFITVTRFPIDTLRSKA